LSRTHRVRELPDGAQYPSTISKQDPQLLEVLVSQIRQNTDIDAVSFEALGVFGHAELCQPVGNRLHDSPPVARYPTRSLEPVGAYYCAARLIANHAAVRSGFHPSVRCMRADGTQVVAFGQKVRSHPTRRVLSRQPANISSQALKSGPSRTFLNQRSGVIDKSYTWILRARNGGRSCRQRRLVWYCSSSA